LALTVLLGGKFQVVWTSRSTYQLVLIENPH
jgi:hypothetical protein